MKNLFFTLFGTILFLAANTQPPVNLNDKLVQSNSGNKATIRRTSTATTTNSECRSWDQLKTASTTSQNGKYKIEVKLNLIRDYYYSVPNKVQYKLVVHFFCLKKVLGNWQRFTPKRVKVSGAFSGPRSPRKLDGSYGYILANPYHEEYEDGRTQLIHFIDEADASLPCFSMDHATYSAEMDYDEFTQAKSLNCALTW